MIELCNIFLLFCKYGKSLHQNPVAHQSGIAGVLQGNLLNADLADMLFKSAAVTTTAPMGVTGDHSYQQHYAEQAYSYQSGSYQQQ